MIIIAIVSLCAITVNSQLAFIWLMHQQFQCAQNVQNYREAVHQQYICILSRTHMCVAKTSLHSQIHPYMHLHSFCGFIEITDVSIPETIWIIHVKANFHLHFLTFSLFHNYWYCDYEYLRVIGRKRISTFCGYRLPWIHDVSDSIVKLIFSTQRFGSGHYSITFQYYGAYVQSHQHFTKLVNPTSSINILSFNTKNVFEMFHLISNSKLEVLYLKTIDVCNMSQMVCYDGPGIKSPTLQHTYNHSQWTCQSSTFQMVCRVSRSDVPCNQIPTLRYHTIRARQEDFQEIRYSMHKEILLIDDRISKGTSKYIYNLSRTYIDYPFDMSLSLTVGKIKIGFPYMLFEGHGCIYGGLYIIETLSTGDTELWSHCDQSEIIDLNLNMPARQLVILLFHYSGYSADEISFKSSLRVYQYDEILPVNLIDMQNQTVTIDFSASSDVYKLYIQSYLVNMRHVRYFHINIDLGDNVIDIEFNVHGLDDSCVFCSVSYTPPISNLFMARHHDMEISNKALSATDYIQHIFLNQSGCHLFAFPVWSLYIGKTTPYINEINKTYHFVMPVLRGSFYHAPVDDAPGPVWLMVYLKRPQNLSHHAIWELYIEVDNTVDLVSLEVMSNVSSTIYEWDHHRSNGINITVEEAINVLYEIRNGLTSHFNWHERLTFEMTLVRKFTYTDFTENIVAAQNLYYTYHNQR